MLLPTVAKLLGCSFTDFGTSLVDVRSTGLRRYARIFQRKKASESLNINVACVTDRDIMPNCAPQICINEAYTGDKNTWPTLVKRAWRAEADYDQNGIDEHVKNIKEKADGQSVQTFVADYWTLEYDLAYKGLQDKDMRDILIDSVIKVSYVEKNRKSAKEKLVEKIDSFIFIEEKASCFYSFFASKKASKADFAQELAVALEKKYLSKTEELKKVLPNYLVDAIFYVTKE